MLGDPNANRSLIQWVGWAGQWPEGRTPTPKPSRKKERERDRDRDRETEQRDRETETERQRDRTERQRDRETETETETDRHPVLDFPACPRHIAKMYERLQGHYWPRQCIPPSSRTPCCVVLTAA